MPCNYLRKLSQKFDTVYQDQNITKLFKWNNCTYKTYICQLSTEHPIIKGKCLRSLKVKFLSCIINIFDSASWSEVQVKNLDLQLASQVCQDLFCGTEPSTCRPWSYLQADSVRTELSCTTRSRCLRTALEVWGNPTIPRQVVTSTNNLARTNSTRSSWSTCPDSM